MAAWVNSLCGEELARGGFDLLCHRSSLFSSHPEGAGELWPCSCLDNVGKVRKCWSNPWKGLSGAEPRVAGRKLTLAFSSFLHVLFLSSPNTSLLCCAGNPKPCLCCATSSVSCPAPQSTGGTVEDGKYIPRCDVLPIIRMMFSLLDKDPNGLHGGLKQD